MEILYIVLTMAACVGVGGIVIEYLGKRLE